MTTAKSAFPNRSRWLLRIGLRFLLTIVPVLIIGRQFPKLGDLPWLPWVALLASVLSTALPYRFILGPKGIERMIVRVQERKLSMDKAAGGLAKLASVLATTPLLYGLVTVVTTGELRMYWIFPVLAGLAVFFYRRRLDDIERQWPTNVAV